MKITELMYHDLLDRIEELERKDMEEPTKIAWEKFKKYNQFGYITINEYEQCLKKFNNQLKQ